MVIFTVDKQSSTTFPTASRFSSGFPAETAVHCARLVAAALLLSWAVAGADAASDAETRKIQALIASVERMDATFVRNRTTLRREDRRRVLAAQVEGK